MKIVIYKIFRVVLYFRSSAAFVLFIDKKIKGT